MDRKIIKIKSFKINKRHYSGKNPFLLLVIFMILILVSCNKGIRQRDYGKWDLDNNNRLDENEARSVISNYSYYKEWDLDENRMLDSDELYEGFYGLWDTDDDFLIQENEWEFGNKAFPIRYDASDIGSFEKWDSEVPGITLQEFKEFGKEANIFEWWDKDKDKGISEEEFFRRTLSIWDKDGDGYIEQLEYEDMMETFEGY